MSGALLLLVASVLAPPPGGWKVGERPPNVLVIVADDFGHFDLDTIPTPNLDWLAARGVSFANAWSNTLCSPTRLTIQFGRYSGRDLIGHLIRQQGNMGLDDVDNPGAPFENPSLPELLRPAGYATGAFGKWHISNGIAGDVLEAPRVHGYDTARAISPFNFKGLTQSPNGYLDWTRVDDGESTTEPVYATRAQADAVTDWIRQQRTPWFAYLAFNAPHSPFHVPPVDLLPSGYVVGAGNRGKFEAMVIAMDTKLGDILAAVDLSQTVVMFVGDNGTAGPATAPQQNKSKVKGSLYEGGINVPMIVAGSWTDAHGRTSHALVNTVDFLATLTEIAGVVLPEGRTFDSVSFAPCLLDPSHPGARTFTFSEKFTPNGPSAKTVRQLAVRSVRYKLLVLDADGDGPSPPAEFLFDLLSDPDELVPLDPAALTPEEAESFVALRAYLESRP